MSATQRYQDDPTFRRIVDSLEHMLHYASYTPSELREAILLAATNYEARRAKTFLISNDKIWNEIDELRRKIDVLREESLNGDRPR